MVDRSAIGRRSKRKGSNNERTVTKLLETWWGSGQWSRSPQSGAFGTRAGAEFKANGDIITTAKDWLFCVECKQAENWSLDQLLTAPKSAIYQFWQQTVEETPKNLVPMLIIGKNHVDRLVILDESYFSQLIQPWEDIPHFILRQGLVSIITLVIFPLKEMLKMPPAAFGRTKKDDECGVINMLNMNKLQVNEV